MSPETLIIDRLFPGVGRIKKASGTMKPAVKQRIDDMLTDLYEQGRLDVLREIRDNRRLTLLVVYDAYRRHALHELPLGAIARPLADAMGAWIESLEPGVDYSVEQITSFGTSLGYFTAADPHARVADLPQLLERLRDSLGRTHARSFNMARANAGAFVRKTLKKQHPLWLAIQAVEPRKVPKRPPRPDLTPDVMRNFFPAPDTDALDACAWGMALSGMGPKEFWGQWETRSDRIRVHGTKREARVRDVPLVRPLAVPTISRDAFRQRLEHRAKKRIAPYDFRRTFARWMERAGVIRSHRVAYMGHRAGDVTALYEASEVDAFLVTDAALLRKYLGLPAPAAKRLRKVK